MYLVTGGAGFIGSNLVAALEERGDGDIIVCDWLGKDDKWRNLAKRNLADIIAPEDLGDFLAEEGDKIETIFHMGAISATTATDADLVIENNFKFTLDLWNWCTQNLRRFIYASSAATYGNGDQGFDDDNSSQALGRLQPLNLYGWSKHLFDRRALTLAQNDHHPRQWAGLKFFNVYGPNEYHKGSMKSVVSQIFPTAKAGKTAKLFKSHNPNYADGGQLRDFIHVDDCVSVMLWLRDNRQINGLFNLGTGKARSFADLAGAVYGALGGKPKISYVRTPVEIRDKYQYFTQADMGRLRKAGYDKPFIELEEGVKCYVSEFLDTDNPYR